MSYPKYKAEQEYETLRNELLQGKKYVFERPILIITASIVLIKFINEDYAIYFPLIIVGLLSFNLWFTVNRMGSLARIIAYTQLVLEDKESKWFGWETSLRKYRKYLKINDISLNKIKINEDSVYDNLGYYPTIYYMHIVMMIIPFTLLTVYTLENLEPKNIILNIITLGAFIAFMVYALKNRPKNIKPQIERNRVVWINIFKEWEKL